MGRSSDDALTKAVEVVVSQRFEGMTHRMRVAAPNILFAAAWEASSTAYPLKWCCGPPQRANPTAKRLFFRERTPSEAEGAQGLGAGEVGAGGALGAGA